MIRWIFGMARLGVAEFYARAYRVGRNKRSTLRRCPPSCPRTGRRNAWRSRHLLRPTTQSARDLSQIAEQLRHELLNPRLLHALEPLGGENRAQPREALAEVTIDQHVVVLVPVRDLLRGIAQAARDLLAGAFPAPLEAGLKLGRRRRQHEDAHHIAAHLAVKLLRALPVDVEQHVAPGGERLFHRLPAASAFSTGSRGVP